MKKPALGMPVLPPVPKRTTLVKFFKLDVDFGFFISSELDPYKTPLLTGNLSVYFLLHFHSRPS